MLSPALLLRCALWMDLLPYIFRLNSVSGFTELFENDNLFKYKVSLEINQVKNTNKNPVSETTIGELKESL